MRRVIGIWRDRGVLGRDDSDRLSGALDDPDAFMAVEGSGGNAQLLGAALGVLGTPTALFRERSDGSTSSGGSGNEGSFSARSDGSSAPSKPGASAGGRTAFYGTGFSSDVGEAAVPTAWGTEEEGAWKSAAAVKEEATAAAAAALQRAATERAESEEAAAARPSTPLTILEQAAAGLLGSDGEQEKGLSTRQWDPLLLRFQAALDSVDLAEGKCAHKVAPSV